MPTYEIEAFVWDGLNSANTLSTLTISDDDSEMSAYFTSDSDEELTINGTTYTDPQGGTYELTFTDSDGDTHTEDFLLWYTGSNYIFAPLPGSEFDDGSVITSLGGWQEWRSGFDWEDVTCFTSGTFISTPDGKRRIEELQVGDRVLTRDGSEEIRWIGQRLVPRAEMEDHPKLRPVRISAGSLGIGLPKRDLLVSRQHCMLLRSKVAERMFGEKEVLVPAIKLTDLPGIFLDFSVQAVIYVHLLFETHQVIYAEDAPSESLYTGPQALNTLSAEAREEILTLFPELLQDDFVPPQASHVPPSKLQKRLIARHRQNGNPVVT